MNLARVAVADLDETRLDEGLQEGLEEAVRLAQSGDRDAFGTIVEVTWIGLVRLARSILVDQHEAEDVVQDTLVNAWHKLGALRTPSAIRPWLQRSVARRCYRLAKKPRHEVFVERPVDPASLLHLDLPGLLNQLSPKQRAVFYLGCIEGCDDREIAERLGMLPPTVRVHRLRARRRLRQLLE